MAEDPFLRFENQTFADESFKIADRHGPIVLAQLPKWSPLSWHAELARRCGADLKWAKVRRVWSDLGHELRRVVLRDLRDALITIVDPSLYRFELERSLIAVAGQPKHRWPPQFSAYVEALLEDYEREAMLSDSPVRRIELFLEEDGGLILGEDIRSKPNSAEGQSLESTVSQMLEKPHSLRLFGARSPAAFAVLLDRDEWERALEDLWDMRYVTPQQIIAHLLRAGDRTQHVFDEGNRPSVRAIARLRDAVRQKLSTSGLIALPDTSESGIVEQSSADSPMLQAADLAAGYARTLYLDCGLKIVCEEFRGVVLNGSMVRDWTRVERPDLALLR